MKNVIFVALFMALGFVGAAQAIQPPTITQPKPGILRVTWSAPTTRADGSALPAAEIAGYELYLTNEAAVTILPASATSYDYTVPVGYTTKSTDSAAMIAVDTGGLKSAPSPSVALPVGVTTPKPLPGAPTSLSVVRVPN